MSNLLDEFQKQLSPNLIDFLSKSIGGESKEATTTAASSIFSVLMNAMQKNAAKENGADNIFGAIQRDHDGSILDHAVEFLSGMRAPQNSNMLNASGILKHVLGQNQGQVVDRISKVSGLNAMDVGQLLLKIAPIAMGVLGRTQRQQNLNAGGLFDLLKNSTQQVNQRAPQASIFERILDQDGDGSIIDDIANFGLKNLGNIFKR